MKIYTLAFLISVIAFNLKQAAAQDTIILKCKHEIIIADIIKVSDIMVKYKKPGETEVHSVDRSEIATIKFLHGQKDVFTDEETMNPRLRAGIALTTLALPMGFAAFYAIPFGALSEPGSTQQIALLTTGSTLLLFSFVSIIAGPILIHRGRKERKLQENKAYLALPVLNMCYTKTTGMGFQASMRFHF